MSIFSLDPSTTLFWKSLAAYEAAKEPDTTAESVYAGNEREGVAGKEREGVCGEGVRGKERERWVAAKGYAGSTRGRNGKERRDNGGVNRRDS